MDRRRSRLSQNHLYLRIARVLIALLGFLTIFSALAEPDQSRNKVPNCIQLSGLAEKSIMPIVNNIALHVDLSDGKALTSAFSGKIDFKYGDFCCVAVAVKQDDMNYIDYVEYENHRINSKSVEINLNIYMSGFRSGDSDCPLITRDEVRDGLAGSNHDDDHPRVAMDGPCDCGTQIRHFLPKDQKKYGTDVIWDYDKTNDGIFAIHSITIRSVADSELDWVGYSGFE